MHSTIAHPGLQGGIIAAGEGSRLRADGFGVSKPMVPVGGRPLIDHALDRFRCVGVRRLVIIINEKSDDCRAWLDAHARDFDLEMIVRNTQSSFASFQLVARRLFNSPAVITTVDSVVALDDFKIFVQSASAFAKNANAVVLGVTDHVDDENPLWVELDPSDGRVRKIGAGSGTHVTAGFYWIGSKGFREPGRNFARLRDYLGWLVSEGQPVYGVALPRVFDIDRAGDVVAAERAGLVSLRENSP